MKQNRTTVLEPKKATMEGYTYMLQGGGKHASFDPYDDVDDADDDDDGGRPESTHF